LTPFVREAKNTYIYIFTLHNYGWYTGKFTDIYKTVDICPPPPPISTEKGSLEGF